MRYIFSFPMFLILVLVSCDNLDNPPTKKKSNTSFSSDAQAIIEIPAGTLDKFELDKKSNKIKHEHKNGKPRIVQYLAYPTNYGYIPHTLLAKENGGDGDPLDVLILGAAVKRKAKLDIKIIGALKLLDRGEQDDKLIAVAANTPFEKLNSINQLNSEFPGASVIIETWLSNYKGKGKMESQGFIERPEAINILNLSKETYKLETHI